MRAPRRLSPQWHTGGWDDDPALAGAGAAWPDAHVDERNDRVLFGPRGEEIARLRDRPFRGYRGTR